MNRRRMMLQGQEEDEVKEWVELLNESKEVTDQKTVEFSLANADSHEEYWIFIQAVKHTGAEQCKGNCVIKLNGASIGYYTFSGDFGGSQNNASYHIWMNPLKLLEVAKHVNSMQFNSTTVQRQEFVGDETGTGKFTLAFPANYTGKITAKILGR